MDCVLLGTMPLDSLPGDVDIPIGPHLILVQREGYEDLTDEVEISPNSILERSYSLSKKHGLWWYVSRGSIAAAGLIGLYYATSRGDGEPADDELLGLPPDPPN